MGQIDAVDGQVVVGGDDVLGVALLERGVLGGRDEGGAADEEAEDVGAGGLAQRGVGMGVRRVQLFVGVGGGDGEVAGEGFGAEADGPQVVQVDGAEGVERAGERVGEGGARLVGDLFGDLFGDAFDERGGDPGQVPFGERAVVALEGDQGGDADGPVHRPVGDEEFVDQCVYGCGIHEAPSPR